MIRIEKTEISEEDLQRTLLTLSDTPWIDYLEIEENGERSLRDDTPEEIRKKYEEHLQKIEEPRAKLTRTDEGFLIDFTDRFLL